MPDLEKVIKKLESLRDICNAKSNMAIGKGKVAWAGYANTADDAIALLKEQEPCWISVKDRLPPKDDNKKVLTYGNPVTHWMPLPEPPEVSQMEQMRQ